MKRTRLQYMILSILFIGAIVCSFYMGRSQQPVEKKTSEKIECPIPTWEIVSTDPKDFNITYSIDSLESLVDYPLDKLIAYRFGSDGAASESAGEEIYKRFISNPETIVRYLSLISLKDDREYICSVIADSFYGYGTKLQLDKILEEFETSNKDDVELKILLLIQQEYKKTANRMDH